MELNEKDNLLKNANQDKYKTIEKTLVSQFSFGEEKEEGRKAQSS